MTGKPMTKIFDVRDLKPECLHDVTKTAAILSNIGQIMALTLSEGPAFELAVKLEQEHS
jgi:hypothetical protein